MDEENSRSIFEYVSQDKRHIKKFQFICDIILEGLRNSKVYGKAQIDNKSANITAMKFFIGQENDRIYCKEIKKGDNVNIIIACELLEKKKNTKFKHREKTVIERISTYEYEI
ncbi:MAG: hypothetical protein K9J25_11280 [Bacteroidales bacterium]|nr:hypothetical protein [Bacteroidales bacterium]